MTRKPTLPHNRESMLQVRKEVVVSQARLNQVSADDHGYLQQITRNQRAISAALGRGTTYLLPCCSAGLATDGTRIEHVRNLHHRARLAARWHCDPDSESLPYIR